MYVSAAFPIVSGRKSKHWISSSFHSCLRGGRPPMHSFLPWGIWSEGQSSPSHGSSSVAAAARLLWLPTTKPHWWDQAFCPPVLCPRYLLAQEAGTPEASLAVARDKLEMLRLLKTSFTRFFHSMGSTSSVDTSFLRLISNHNANWLILVHTLRAHSNQQNTLLLI